MSSSGSLEGGAGGDAIAVRVEPLVVSPGGGGAGEDSDGEEVVAAVVTAVDGAASEIMVQARAGCRAAPRHARVEEVRQWWLPQLIDDEFNVVGWGRTRTGSALSGALGASKQPSEAAATQRSEKRDERSTSMDAA